MILWGGYKVKEGGWRKNGRWKGTMSLLWAKTTIKDREKCKSFFGDYVNKRARCVVAMIRNFLLGWKVEREELFPFPNCLSTIFSQNYIISILILFIHLVLFTFIDKTRIKGAMNYPHIFFVINKTKKLIIVLLEYNLIMFYCFFFFRVGTPKPETNSAKV